MRSTHELLERSMKRSECGASKEKGAKTMGGEWRSFSIHWDLARSKHAKDDKEKREVHSKKEKVRTE